MCACVCVCVVWLQIRVAALQNLVRIMSLYYQHMESYMGPALFAVSPPGAVKVEPLGDRFNAALVLCCVVLGYTSHT